MSASNSQDSFQGAVKDVLSELRMVERGDRILVGVSGGPDSVALIHVLVSLAKSMNLTLIVAHVNHNLRPTSEEERDFVSSMASRLGLDFFHLDADVKGFAREKHLGLEEAGRRIRYSYFQGLKRELEAHKIATAHHVDDQIETFFLRLLRGTTSTGLRGIPAVIGNIIRPLIKMERSRILDYLHSNSITYIIDETNLQSSTDRNFMRNDILKTLERRFPGYRRTILRTIALLTRDDDFIEQQAHSIYSDSIHLADSTMSIDIGKLKHCHDSVTSRVIRKALYEVGGASLRLGEINILQAISLMNSQDPSSGLDLPNGLKMKRDYDRLVISKGEEDRFEGFSYLVDGPGIVHIPGTGYSLNFSVRTRSEIPEDFGNDPNVVYFDITSLSFPLLARSVLPGDRIELWGSTGSSKVKKVFIDNKISLVDRRKIPLVVKDDSVLLIAGIRRSRLHEIRKDSSEILEIKLIPRFVRE